MEFITDEQREHLHGNVLLLGPPKSGKTTGACSAPGLVGLLNCDQPNASELAHDKFGERIKELALPPVGIKALLAEIMQSCYPPEGSPIIDTWVVDPIGDLHRRLFKELKPAVNTGNAMRDAYGEVATIVEDFCRFMCEAPCNFVMVAHDYPVQDEGTGTFNVMPWTGTKNPAVGRKVLGMVDVIAYTGLIPISEEDPHLRSVAQIVATEGRACGVRGRFNRLLTDEALDKGIVDLDLYAWFKLANKHLGDDPRNDNEAATAVVGGQDVSN